MRESMRYPGRLAAGAVLAACLALGAGGSALASEGDFLDRFTGDWSGGGMAQRTLDSTPREVSCTAEGTRDGDSVTVSGTCKALMVFTRDVSVTITHDPASDQYSGTYVGSRIGPAQLSGRRDGDTLDMTLTWPREVNGDRTAQMTIRNTDDGRLQIVVSDRPGGTGEPVQTTNLTFTRR